MAGKASTTKAAALTAVLSQYRTTRGEVANDLAGKVLNEDLVRDVFNCAWKYQFSEGRRDFKSEVRELIRDRVDEARLVED